jgi:hypothetical protein
MLQLVYVSTVCQSMSGKEPTDILAVSRRNNARDAITGLLYSDGTRFLQALEGPADKVEAAFARIRRDDRHRAIVLLSRRDVSEREFGEWNMAHRFAGTDGEAFVAQVAALAATASPSVRATFEGFASVRRAA